MHNNLKKMKLKKTNKIKYILVAALVLVCNLYFLVGISSAAPLTNSYIVLNRMTTATATSVRLVFKSVATTNGAATASINFDGIDTTKWSASSGSVFTGSIAITSASCAATTGATALAGALSATGSGSNLISISGITGITATPTLYCVDFTLSNTVTTPSAGEYHPVVTVGSDSMTVAVRTIANDSLIVSATVLPTFNLALSSNADTFVGGLTSASVKVSTGNTVTINTNSKNGWFVYAFSVSASGLTSVIGATNIPAITPGAGTTLTAGTPGYVFGVTANSQVSGSGTTTVVASYSSNGTTTGSGLDTTIRKIASGSGTSNTATLTIKELAAISALTPSANDYTDTTTIIGAGYF